jgi:hypothetical protein
MGFGIGVDAGDTHARAVMEDFIRRRANVRDGGGIKKSRHLWSDGHFSISGAPCAVFSTGQSVGVGHFRGWLIEWWERMS